MSVVAAVLILTGAAFCLLGALGVARLPDTLSRLQAATKAQTLGLLLVLLGVAAESPARYVSLLVLIAALQLCTAPVMAQIVSRIAYRTDERNRRDLVVDELERHLPPSRN